MKHHTFRTRHLQANNIECVNLSVEKPFHVPSQIHSSSLSVKNKITQCVSSALLLNTPPIKNLLSRVQEPPDPITRVQVGSGVEEPMPGGSFPVLNFFVPPLTSTPAAKAKPNDAISTTTTVKLTINYPSKVVEKVLSEEYQAMISRKNMTMSKQNRDVHWVNHKMFINRVSGNDLPNDGP